MESDLGELVSSVEPEQLHPVYSSFNLDRFDHFLPVTDQEVL